MIWIPNSECVLKSGSGYHPTSSLKLPTSFQAFLSRCPFLQTTIQTSHISRFVQRSNQIICQTNVKVIIISAWVSMHDYTPVFLSTAWAVSFLLSSSINVSVHWHATLIALRAANPSPMTMRDPDLAGSFLWGPKRKFRPGESSKRVGSLVYFGSYVAHCPLWPNFPLTMLLRIQREERLDDGMPQKQK